MDDPLALRNSDAERRLGKAAADAEDQIGAIEEVAERPRYRRAAGAEREAMGLVERAFAGEARADRRGEQLGQRRELVISLGPVDALAGMDDRPLGRDEGIGRCGDRF